MSLRGFEPLSTGPKPVVLSKLYYRPSVLSSNQKIVYKYYDNYIFNLASTKHIIDLHFLTSMKTLITAPAYFPEEVVSVFRSFSDVTVKQMDHQELLEAVADYEILAIRVDTVIDKTLLDKAANLKVIATATTGLNHIDVDYAKEKGVEVISLQGANTAPTAEHVMGLLLALVRKIPAAFSSIVSGKWDREKFIGTGLEGKKLGIVGFGRIGQHVGKFARAFGMELLAFDPYLPDEKFGENNATKMELDDLMKEADVVTLHMFLSDETKGTFNLAKLQLMKKSAFLINCSRGAVLVEEDIVTALKEGVIAGAALDVYCAEPLEQGNVLVAYAKEHSNLILTPHIAGSTKESALEAGMYVAEKTKEFLDTF
jgi:D-3-phosphoglycerate dehydrogenase / 2-oxoglutarate reductase